MMVEIGSRNIAPTDEDKINHFKIFSIDSNDLKKPFVFSEMIGVGHAEHGGGIRLGVNELESWPGKWREHLKLSGSSWVIGFIEEGIKKGYTSEVISKNILDYQSGNWSYLKIVRALLKNIWPW